MFYELKEILQRERFQSNYTRFGVNIQEKLDLTYLKYPKSQYKCQHANDRTNYTIVILILQNTFFLN